MPTLIHETPAGRWAHRLAILTALLAIPLVIFGGSVTTLGAGLSVQGWLVAEGHFMLFLPIDTWLDNTQRFVEHVHRLFGAAVGFAAIATCAAAWIAVRRGGRARSGGVLATFALVAIIAQGIVGGERVELFSDRLAFLHGAMAQAVLATLFASALALSARWRASGKQARKGLAGGAAARGWAFTALGVCYLQIVLGAWYRHTLRPDDNPDAAVLLYAHVCGAIVVLAVLAVLSRKLKEAAEAGEKGATLRACGRRMNALLSLQVLLGLLSWIGYRPGSIGPLEWALSVAHVLFGGLLLAQLLVTAMWTARFSPRAIGFQAALEAGGKA